MGLDFKLRTLLKLNLKLFLEMHLLREGDFYNIPSGSTFYDGSDQSLFLADAEAHRQYTGLSVGQVFQSPFKNFLYESGVPLDGTNVGLPPIIISGIYVQGAFRSPTDLEFGHIIDYRNGRIIFNQPKPLTLPVHANFSVRGTRVDFEHAFNQQFQAGLLESKYFTNPLTSQHLVYTSGTVIQSFPAVFIELDDRELKPYEMGNRSAQITEKVNLYVWALDDIQRDNIIEVLTGQWRKTIPIIDFNIMPLPLSGIHNTLSPEYIPYQNLLRNNRTVTTVGSGLPIRYLAYIDDATSKNSPAMEEYERSRVSYDLSIYLNAPTTPLGHVFGPITNIPTIEDIGM